MPQGLNLLALVRISRNGPRRGLLDGAIGLARGAGLGLGAEGNHNARTGGIVLMRGGGAAGLAGLAVGLSVNAFADALQLYRAFGRR